MTQESSLQRNRSSAATRRVRQHVILSAISLALVSITFAAAQSDDWRWRTSVATAYASMTLLVAALVVGPFNVLRGRPNPVSTNLRRDIGIWAGTVGLVHVIVGLQVHFGGKMWPYFIYPGEWPHHIPVRYDAFGLANYTGLAAGLILVLLLALSNDFSLRRFGSHRWKTLQRANYVGLALTIVHGIVYQAMEKRDASFVAVFVLQVMVALTLQWAGYRRTRRERVGSAASPSRVS